MKKKRIFIILATIILVVGMTACGSGGAISSVSSSGGSAPVSAEKTEQKAPVSSAKKDEGPSSVAKEKSENTEKQESGSNNGSGSQAAKPEKSEPKTSGSTAYCYMSIDCRELYDAKNSLPASLAGRVPAGGVILPKTKVALSASDTVYSVLMRVTRAKGIQTDVDGSNSYNTKYVRAIDNFYEFDAGDQSGWIYTVNGAVPQMGSSAYKLKSGDTVKWQYTLKLGEDL